MVLVIHEYLSIKLILIIITITTDVVFSKAATHTTDKCSETLINTKHEVGKYSLDNMKFERAKEGQIFQGIKFQWICPMPSDVNKQLEGKCERFVS
jgi:hypothetical protein